jgi:hypothetical protein
MDGPMIGKYTQTSATTLKLVVQKSVDEVFTVYASADNNTASAVKFYFANFDGADASVFFAEDALQKPVYQPVFDDKSFLGDYTVSKPSGKYNLLKIACHLDGEFRRRAPQNPYKALVYTFPLLKKYTAYHIVFDSRATMPDIIVTLEKKGNTYILDGKDIGERKDLTETMINNVKGYKEEIRKALEVERNGLYKDQDPNSIKLTSSKADTISLAKSTEKALFAPKSASQNK